MVTRLRAKEVPSVAEVPTQAGAVPAIPSLTVDPYAGLKTVASVVTVRTSTVLRGLDVACVPASLGPELVAVTLEEELVESPKAPVRLPKLAEAVDQLVEAFPVLHVPASGAEVGRQVVEVATTRRPARQSFPSTKDGQVVARLVLRHPEVVEGLGLEVPTEATAGQRHASSGLPNPVPAALEVVAYPSTFPADSNCEA